jgi:hypothetical protein
MEDHETRRNIIRPWMALPKDKRQTPEQAAALAKKTVEQNELQRSRYDPYEKMTGWLLPRVARSWLYDPDLDNSGMDRATDASAKILCRHVGTASRFGFGIR